MSSRSLSRLKAAQDDAQRIWPMGDGDGDDDGLVDAFDQLRQWLKCQRSATL